MSIPTPDLLAALLLGLLGSSHCVGMCGGISSALAFALPRNTPALRRHGLLLLYSCGRVASYSLMGAVAAFVLGSAAADQPRALAALRVFAGLMLVLMGLQLLGWSGVLAPLERLGGKLWLRLQPRLAQLLPVDSSAKALLAGIAWGWLPCGLVYSTLSWAASRDNALHGATLMLLFGLGTTPAVLASGALAVQLRALLQRRSLRTLGALAVIGFGVWTMAAVLLPAGHGPHHH